MLLPLTMHFTWSLNNQMSTLIIESLNTIRGYSKAQMSNKTLQHNSPFTCHKNFRHLEQKLKYMKVVDFPKLEMGGSFLPVLFLMCTIY